MLSVMLVGMNRIETRETVISLCIHLRFYYEGGRILSTIRGITQEPMIIAKVIAKKEDIPERG